MGLGWIVGLWLKWEQGLSRVFRLWLRRGISRLYGISEVWWKQAFIDIAVRHRLVVVVVIVVVVIVVAVAVRHRLCIVKAHRSEEKEKAEEAE